MKLQNLELHVGFVEEKSTPDRNCKLGQISWAKLKLHVAPSRVTNRKPNVSTDPIIPLEPAAFLTA